MQRTNSLGKNWFWSRLKAGGEGDDRGQDAWTASLTQQTWVWASSGRWWWWKTGKPGVLHIMGLQRVWHDWATEQHCLSLLVCDILLWRLQLTPLHLGYKKFLMVLQNSIPSIFRKETLKTWRPFKIREDVYLSKRLYELCNMEGILTHEAYTQQRRQFQRDQRILRTWSWYIKDGRSNFHKLNGASVTWSHC